MNEPSSTLDLVLGEVAAILSPLSRRFTPELAPATFASLGIATTTNQVTQLAAELAATVSHVADVVSAISAVRDATSAEARLEQAIAAAAKIARVVADVTALAHALSAIGFPQAAIDALPDRLFGLLLGTYVERSTGLAEILELAGVLERTDVNVDSTDPARPFYTTYAFHFDRIAGWLTNPGQQLQMLYDWGTPAFDGTKLLPALDQALAMLGLPVAYDDSGTLPVLDLVGLTVRPSATSPRGLVIALADSVTPATLSFEGPDWSVAIDAGLALLPGTGVTIAPNGDLALTPPGATTVAGRVGVTLDKTRTAPDSILLLGDAGGSRLQVQQLHLALGTDFAWTGGAATGAVAVTGALTGGMLVIDAGSTDGFVGALLGGQDVQAAFDVGIGYSSATGLTFTGAGALVIRLPLHLSLGPVDVPALTLSIGVASQTFPIQLSADLHAKLGPIDAVVQQVGLELDITVRDDHGGNAGPLDVAAAFKPPSGVGLSVDAALASGGGFLAFDTAHGQYSGAAEISIAGVVTVKAIGVITTQQPNGGPGYSLLLLLTTDFPPIQLGFGFTLNAIGGLLGVDRAAQLDALRDGVRTGAIASLLFPTDVVGNAPRLISDLSAMFPVQSGSFVIAPMAKIAWGTPALVTLSLGLIATLPAGDLALVGVLQVALPEASAPLVLIHVAFIGELDLAAQLISFDASLYDSHVLSTPLTGAMSARFKWGDNAGLLIAVGGFHPAFTPPPGANLPQVIDRIAFSLLDHDDAKIKITGYFAVTSNTMQFGAQLTVYFAAGGAKVSGQLGFDALMQRSPFHFDAQITGSLSLSVSGLDLLGINLRFELEGLTPGRAQGTGSISLLFFSVDVHFDVSWGDAQDTSLPQVAVMPIVIAALAETASWRALPPPTARLSVTLAAPPIDVLVLHPFGSLAIEQRAVPLGLALDHVGGQAPSDVRSVDVTAVASGGSALPIAERDEAFAIAQFQDLDDHDKLSRPSYQPLKAGVTVGSADAIVVGTGTQRQVSYDQIVVDLVPAPPVRTRGTAGLFTSFLGGNAAARALGSQRTRTRLAPTVAPVSVAVVGGYTVASTLDNRALDATSRFASEAIARQYLEAQQRANPALSGALHVLPDHEVNDDRGAAA